MSTKGQGQYQFTRVGGLLQLLPVVCLAPGALVGCTSSVAGDGTQTSVQSQPDAGGVEPTTNSQQSSVNETTSGTQQSSTTKPGSSTTGSSTHTSASVEPTTTTSNTNDASSQVTETDDDEPSSTSDEETSTESNSDAGGSEETSSEETDETTEPTPGGHGVFVAMGHGQRTTVSCDDGQTWTHNRFTDDIPLSGTDTDHIPFSMRAASYDAGAFYIAWGWGVASYVERSFDGVTWEGIYGVADPEQRSGDDWIWGLAAADGKVVMGENRQFFFSPDQGESWEVGNPGVVAQKVIFGAGGGSFVAVAEGQDQGGPEFLYSGDGLTWSNDVDVPQDCIGGRVTSIPFGGGAFLFAADSHFCRSTDGGQSWQYASVPVGRVVTSLYDGNRFISLTYNSGNDTNALFASTDATDWEQVGAIPGSGGRLAVSASKTTGTVVAARNNKFYRSEDGGASFEELPSSAYTDEGGPITQIEFGTVASSDACP